MRPGSPQAAAPQVLDDLGLADGLPPQPWRSRTASKNPASRRYSSTVRGESPRWYRR